MAGSHEIWDGLDVHQPSVDLGWCTKGETPTGCKWIFKKKIEIDGQVKTYKARLLVNDFSQSQRIDYDETFSPVAILKSIQILLAIAAYYDYKIWQMIVKIDFLNGNLEEEVYWLSQRDLSQAGEGTRSRVSGLDLETFTRSGSERLK